MVDRPAADTPESVSAPDNKNTAQFVGFRLGDQQYAFRIEQIQEIVMHGQVTATPQVADCVEGVSNLRGAIIPIINLRKLLGLEPRSPDSETRTIVVNVGDKTMGCTVDMVSQVIRIPSESVQTAPETVTADGADYITGFAKLDDRLVILLDIERLLCAERLQHGSQTELSESSRTA